MLECVPNNEPSFGDHEKTMENLKDHRSVTDGDNNNGLDPPSTPSAAGREKDSSYVSSSSEDNSVVHRIEEECEESFQRKDSPKEEPLSSSTTPIITNATSTANSTTTTPSKLNDTIQEICTMSISSSLPALQENDADVDVTPSGDLEDLEVEINHASTTNEAELKERISHLENQLYSLTCTLQDLMVSVDVDPNRLKKNHLDNDRSKSPETPAGISKVSSMILLEEDSPEVRKNCISIDHLTTPDLNYRSYTPDYEQELRNFRKTSRGMSLDNTKALAGSQEDLKHLEQNLLDGKESTARTTSGGDLRKLVEAPSTAGAINTPVLVLPPLHTTLNNAVEKEDVSLRKVEMKTTQTKDDIVSQVDVRQTHDGKVKISNASQQSSSGHLKTIPLPSPLSPTSRIKLKRNVSMIMQATWNPSSGTTSLTQQNAVIDFIKSLNIDSRQQDGSATEDVDENMEEFLRVPFRIESLLWFGIATCFDCFLHILTVTPLKFVWSCICLICTIIKPGKGIGSCSFHRRHFFQLLRVFVIVAVYKYVLCPISIGKLYHWIRGQAMLKLYVLMSMVEVFDRLMCSLGQDALDSLYWNCTRRPYHPRMIASTIVVLVYTIIHSLILFVHVATLNVAMNSADQALLALLISGNFAEIKSTVFKKYNKQNLFKITTSDICERFKLFLFLGLVLLLNCSQGGMNKEMVNDYLYMSGLIIFAEMLCDWVKHSFITKFNFIKSSVYYDYSLVMAGDITGIGHDSMNIEVTHAVVKRLGFPQIPLVCVMFRYFREAARYAETLTHDGDSNHVLYGFAVVLTQGAWYTLLGYFIFFFICLFALKFLLGYAIVTMARNIFLYGPLEVENEKKDKLRR